MKVQQEPDLFKNIPNNNERLPDNNVPGLAISDYVLNEMPVDLAAIQVGTLEYSELSARHARILEGLVPFADSNSDNETAELIQLDLAFMLGAYLPLGEQAYNFTPPQLHELLKSQSERFGLSPYMDYELIIDINTREYHRIGKMRTFLDGTDALSERDFYLGHSEGEKHIKIVVDRLMSIIKNPNQPEIDDMLKCSVENMRLFNDYMKKYHGMSGVVFSLMKPYLASYPDGTRNAKCSFSRTTIAHSPTDEQTKLIDESLKSTFLVTLGP
jgi:hypothetical protein